MGEFRPRVARPAGLAWNLTKTWVQTALMWTTFLVLLPWGVYELETALSLGEWRVTSELEAAIGIGSFTAFGALGLWLGVLFAVHGRGTPLPFDTAPRLVIAGPYRVIRNPMAIASFGQGFGVAIYVGSPLIAAYVVCGMFIWNFVARPWEERDLVQRFGASYEAYRDAVPCWRVRLSPYRPEAEFGSLANSNPLRASGES
jgi:protein-S-isoprenylcysteine O-methyltransferase Ste14